MLKFTDTYSLRKPYKRNQPKNALKITLALNTQLRHEPNLKTRKSTTKH